MGSSSLSQTGDYVTTIVTFSTPPSSTSIFHLPIEAQDPPQLTPRERRPLGDTPVTVEEYTWTD
jgi:hypothetical protein